MEKLNLKNLNVNRAKSYNFYQIPKELIDNSAFDNIDYGSKILYSLMLNRSSLSAINPDFIDVKGDVYIIYTIEQAMESMRCSRQTAVKMLKQLDEIGLIEKKRRGQGLASLIYVKDFSTVNIDFSTDKNEPDFKKSKKWTSESLNDDISRSLKNRLQEVQNVDPSYTNQNHTNQSYTDSSYNNINQSAEVPNTIDNLKPMFDDNIGFANNDCDIPHDYLTYINNLNFEYLNTKYTAKHSTLLEIRNLIFKTLSSGERTFRIAQKPMPGYQVKEALRSLDYKHIEYLIKSLKDKKDIKRYEPYLLTSLVNAAKLEFSDVEHIKETVKNNIELDNLLVHHSHKQNEILELYNIIVEILASKKKVIRIARGDLPLDLVQDTFGKLSAKHIYYVMNCLRKNTTGVKSTKAYLQTTLYNSVNTIDNQISFDVQKHLYDNLGIELK